jgi:hypothetical protein
MSDKIKYCPFCHINKSSRMSEDLEDYVPGLRVREFGWGKKTLYAVMCDACGTNGPPRPSRAEAIGLWNTRRITPGGGDGA